MDSNGKIWIGLNKNNFSNQTYWNHLGQFESDSNFHNYYNLNYELIP